MKTGIELIAEKRQRQITEEGWTAANDDQHNCGEMADAAAVYAFASSSLAAGCQPDALKADILDLETGGEGTPWPWHPKWLKLGTPKDCLIKGGALIAAELDRLQRLEDCDPTPYCGICKAATRENCQCPPIAENE